MEMSCSAVDDIIRCLQPQPPGHAAQPPGGEQPNKQAQLGLGEGEIRSLCIAAKDMFKRQPNLVDWTCSCGSPRSPISFFLCLT